MENEAIRDAITSFCVFYRLKKLDNPLDLIYICQIIGNVNDL